MSIDPIEVDSPNSIFRWLNSAAIGVITLWDWLDIGGRDSRVSNCRIILRNTMDNSALENSARLPLYRPPFQLRSLPVKYRWEVSRRHAYYQLCSEQVRRYYEGKTGNSALESLTSQLGLTYLAAIGISGSPPDPTLEFDELDPVMSEAWLSGAVHPISLRGLASILIAALPHETLAQVGLKLVEGGCREDPGEAPSKSKAMFGLQQLDGPGLDDYPDEPFVSVNPASSGRQIEEAVKRLLTQWKDERDLGEQRSHESKCSEYLKVWDLREGWCEGRYIRSSEMKLRDIATTLKTPLTSVHNHYCRAFEMIVGHPYSPSLWLRLFGQIKFSELFGAAPGPVSRRRPLNDRATRDVPDSVVSPPSSDDGIVQSASVGEATPNDADLSGLIDDILRLIESGHADEVIVRDLDLVNPESIAAVAYVRERVEDFPPPSSFSK